MVAAANFVATLVQYLSDKLGLATGDSLPRLCRHRFRRPVVSALWLQAEAVVVMTDLGEVIGRAIALNILFGLPLPIGGAATAAVSLALISLRSNGRRRFELLMTIALTLLLGVFLSQVIAVDGVSRSVGGLVPHLSGGDSLVMAGSIVGATVIPSWSTCTPLSPANSGMPSRQSEKMGAGGEEPRRRMLQHVRADVLIALGVAGAVNAAFLIAAATSLHGRAPDAGDSLNAAHAAYGQWVGSATAAAAPSRYWFTVSPAPVSVHTRDRLSWAASSATTYLFWCGG
ncbi:Nramp family divalent metal transporter [Streptomyces chartreusis]|uniref:Nramp family divalent metal transporter n=1 Tax=Streptomyces chartreusis TaxID=1969 RepID=UPI003715F7C8